MFNFDLGDHRCELQKQGFAHLKGILSNDFLTYMQGDLHKALNDRGQESQGWKVDGKKRQFVFDFPSARAANQFRAGMARLTDIPADNFTLAERHLKIYDQHAQPYPAPHKDRSAAQFSIGLPVFLAQQSTVCVFPDLDPGHNEEGSAVFLSAKDQDSIEALYASDEAIMLNEKVGDLVIFLGSTLFHERVCAAGTAILYLKINDAGIDPLGHNIYARTTGRGLATFAAE